MLPYCVLDITNIVYIHRQGKRWSDQWFSLPRNIANHILRVVEHDMKPLCNQANNGQQEVSLWKPSNSAKLFEFMIFEAIQKYVDLENEKVDYMNRSTQQQRYLKSFLNPNKNKNHQYHQPQQYRRPRYEVIDLRLPRLVSRYLNKTEANSWNGLKHNMKEVKLKCKACLWFVNRDDCVAMTLGTDENSYIYPFKL